MITRSTQSCVELNQFTAFIEYIPNIDRVFYRLNMTSGDSRTTSTIQLAKNYNIICQNRRSGCVTGFVNLMIVSSRTKYSVILKLPLSKATAYIYHSYSCLS